MATAASSTNAAPAAAAAAADVQPGSVVDRIRGALWGVLIADALSMPVHWCARRV
jgi:hypothetical protein